MILKYWIDENGNISSGKCQIGKLGEVLYNPELQSLDIPPETDDSHIPKVVNGKWCNSLISIPQSWLIHKNTSVY